MSVVKTSQLHPGFSILIYIAAGVAISVTWCVIDFFIYPSPFFVYGALILSVIGVLALWLAWAAGRLTARIFKAANFFWRLGAAPVTAGVAAYALGASLSLVQPWLAALVFAFAALLLELVFQPVSWQRQQVALKDSQLQGSRGTNSES